MQFDGLSTAFWGYVYNIGVSQISSQMDLKWFEIAVGGTFLQKNFLMG
jgi:hypothetical protein